MPILVVGLLAAFQGYVTWRLWRDAFYVRSEKIAQTKLVWMLPLLGSVMVFAMLLDEAKHQRKE